MAGAAAATLAVSRGNFVDGNVSEPATTDVASPAGNPDFGNFMLQGLQILGSAAGAFFSGGMGPVVGNGISAILGGVGRAAGAGGAGGLNNLYNSDGSVNQVAVLQMQQQIQNESFVMSTLSNTSKAQYDAQMGVVRNYHS